MVCLAGSGTGQEEHEPPAEWHFLNGRAVDGRNPTRSEGERLLVVDDEQQILDTVRAYFTPLGYEVECAREREEAEALLAHRHYDLLLADLRLTGTQRAEGLDLLDSLAELKGVLERPLVVLWTGYGGPNVSIEARRRGADAVINKPIPLSELSEFFRQLLSTRASTQGGARP